MKANIRQISEETGFSLATVSNALNQKKGVSPETSRLIFEAAERLGYFTESRISRLKFVTYKKTGEVVEDTPFFPLMIAGVEQECRSLGMDMLICNLDRREDNFEEQLKALQNDKSSMIILLGTELSDEDRYIIDGMKGLFVVIDYWAEDMGFDSVLINNADATITACRYLAAHGHKKIGYLRGNFRIRPFRERSGGYRSALRHEGLEYNEKNIVTLRTTINGAYEDMKAYLARKPKLPTAFFADNDIIALGAMKALNEAGYKIPEDVSIVGFDDISYSSISNPPLTTVKVPKQEIGRAAVRRLRDMAGDHERNHIKTQICTQFIERDSVAEAF